VDRDAVHVSMPVLPVCLNRCRNESISAYMDDSPIVEYVRTTMDVKCNLRLVRSGFGEDAYSIGLPKNSILKVGARRVEYLHPARPSN